MWRDLRWRWGFWIEGLETSQHAHVGREMWWTLVMQCDGVGCVVGCTMGKVWGGVRWGHGCDLRATKLEVVVCGKT